MKILYRNLQRSAFIYAFAVLLGLVATFAQAQQQSQLDPGIVRIKVSEELANRLESSTFSRGSNNVLLTGIQSIDAANIRHKVSGVRRVFRPAGKFEAKHRAYGLHRWYELKMDASASILEALASYGAIEQIERAEPSYKKKIIGSENPGFGPLRVDSKNLKNAPLNGLPNDPLIKDQWHYENTGQAGGTPGSDISIFQAWSIETGTPNVIVAVTDGGAQVDHPDLAANMWINTDEIAGNGLDDDNNGFIDDINGYGFGDDTGAIAPDDHGTHTSGTVAAVTNNGIGVAGVAGGSGVGDGARVMTLATFGGTANGGFAESYVYGADNGAVISQNSWGYTIPDVFEQAVLDGIDYFIAEAGTDENGNQIGPMKGGIVIFAAGNDDANDQFYPGYYDKTLAVGGLTNQDKKAWYSNYGDWVDMSAPGGETFFNNDPQGVLSTVTGGQYAFFQGTSMACPHVSGVAALIISKFGGPGLTPEMVRGRLTQLVDNVDEADPEFAGLLGTGRLNAFKALQEDDGDAPNEISDLTASQATITSVTLNWTSPADPGNGSASVYELRYATFPITNENFSTATLVNNVPAPSPAGTAESFTINGLDPGTVYYFAIRSADFFGNFSGISNVVEQATNFPPVISVSPDTLVADLETAQTTYRNLVINNTGLGILHFSFDSVSSPNFARPEQVSGSVAAGDSLVVSVLFDANNLFTGTYRQELSLVSNDPVTPVITIPAILNVTSNGEPIASVNPDTLRFGQVFVTDTVTQVFSIHNAGSDTLFVSAVISSNPDFVVATGDTISVAPFDHVMVPVTYAPSALGTSSGTISITTNDPNDTTLNVYVEGEGVPAPDIEVSPESLSASLNAGGSETQTLTISNTGGSDLEFSVEVSASAGSAALTSERLLTVPVAGAAAQTGILQKNPDAKGYSGEVRLRSVSKSAAIASVLILSPDDNVTDIETILDAYDDIEADVYPKASLPSITLADVEGYDVILTTNNTQWLQAGGVQPAVIGDLLADYIDGGGKVISNQFAYSYDAWRLEGRFIDDQYGPFIPSTTDALMAVDLGDILSPGHPVVQDVISLTYSGYVQNVTLAPGGTALAEWDNGTLFLAANENVVALNMLPTLGNGGALQWTGDLPLIYQNAVHYLAGPGFVDVSPASGTVAAGEQISLDVTFDAAGLDSGFYQAFIHITSNVPNNELIVVPAQLNVLGPEFTINPKSLAAELPKNQTTTQTITLSNNGSETQPFTVNVEGVGSGASVSIAKISTEETLITNRLSSVADAVSDRKGTRTTASKQVINLAASSAVSIAERGDLSVSKSATNRMTLTQRGVPQQSSEEQYATGFENFSPGDVNGQQGWFGQFGNWTIESSIPYSGSQHFRGLADGLGVSASVSPLVPLGVEDKSTTTMKVRRQGAGVTWQIVPQSPSEEVVNTRIQFDPSGTMSALISDGAGGAAFENIGTIPSGYFDLTIQVDRDSAYFDVFINDEKIYTGQGFAGNIEEVVFLSGMEVAGPTLDIDDFKIIDGTKSSGVSFLTVSPLAGSIAAGTSVQLTVTFNSNDLDFGTYNANINVRVGSTKLTVPASLRVFGDPQIDVDPTFLQATVDYKEDTSRILSIQNTGGNPLNYSLQVIGAATSQAKLQARTAKQSKQIDERIRLKISRDEKGSASVERAATTIQLLTGSQLLTEDFEDASFPPAGWQVVDNEGTGLVWDFAAAYGEGNYAGSGEAATASSDAFGAGEFDTELITPVISTAGFKNIAVQYNVNYQNYLGLDFLDLDIQVDGGAWTNVLRWNEDHGSLFATGVSVTAELGSFIGNGSSFRLRWHYYDPNTGDFDWYAQVDDVVIYGDARTWLSMSPASGVVPVNETAFIEARFDASDLNAGSYVAGVLVSSNAAEDPLVGVVAQLTVRAPAVMTITPESLYQEVMKDSVVTATQTLTITNTGSSMLKYGFDNTPIPTATGNIPSERIQSTPARTIPSAEKINLYDIKAIVPDEKLAASTALLATGFEDFVVGNINGQQGWAGQFGNWNVVALNPYQGMQHVRAVSDGFGASRAFSPVVAIGADPVSSTSLLLDVEEGVTWHVIPQSPTATLVNTRVQIAADGTLSALVQNANGEAVFAPIAATLPSGYFEMRIDVERATSVFTVFIDGAEVFTGQGFAGDIEQVVLFSAMEVAGPVWDVDNLSIFDGRAVAPWLTFNPKSGVIPPGASQTITVQFDASDLEPGTYSDTLTVASNDPVNSTASIPVTFKVMVNTPPVLAAIDSAAVVETGSIDVTFTASDVDNDPVVVTLHENENFITLLSSSNGVATYRIKPSFGNAGEYDLPVVAVDSRGKTDSAIFHLTVIPYGLQSFTLFNSKTNQPVETFSDTVELDITDPDYHKFVIRANTNPERVGSVKFSLNSKQINIDNSSPYTLSENVIKSLPGGDHRLMAKAYTKTNAKGTAGQALTAVIRIVNSSMVTDFDIVKKNGSKLSDLNEGDRIDIANAAYRLVNVKANTKGSKIKSVEFTLNGKVFRVDNLAPYFLNGLGSLIDLPLSPQPGSYTLTATPYSEIYGLGVAGQPFTVRFTVVDGRKGSSYARSSSGDEENLKAEEEESSELSLSVSPVPVRDVLTIALDEKDEVKAGLSIINTEGRQFFSDEGTTSRYRNFEVRTSELNMTPGVYFVKIQYATGRMKVRKFIKE